MQRVQIRNLSLLLGGVAIIAVAWYFFSDSFTQKSRARYVTNPITVNSNVLAESMARFADQCAICHANDGSGQTPLGQGLDPRPPDLRRPGTQRKTDGDLFYIIQNGIRLSGMPAFGRNGENTEDNWKLVHFIRRLPDITARELEQMKSMNPTSPINQTNP
jgi:mono/diheme cytochrome c family protein